MQIELKMYKPLPEWFIENIQGDLEDIWQVAARNYVSKYEALRAHGKKPPQGAQAFINSQLESTLSDRGWEGTDGRFVKDGVWLRITFRHQMSLGSDFMDALLLAHREQLKGLVIAAPSLDFAKVITPKDANSITTYEKLEEYFARAVELFQVPIAIGRLSPIGNIENKIQEVLISRLK
jgi:hypothetical protein